VKGLLGRSLLVVVVLCLGGVGTLWVVPFGTEPSDALPLSAPQSSVARLEAPLPVLQLGAAPAQTLDAPGQPAQPPPAPQPDPLAEWAAETAPLIGVPEPALINYGTADLIMQDREPDCRLSWITLAALGRAGSDQLQPEAGAPAAIATAEEMCSGGRNTTTDKGWESAVRSVGSDSAGDDTAHVHRVLAAATAYAAALESGMPISAPARVAIDFAIDNIGLPYVWGGNGPNLGDAGFDCSGLTKAAYAAAGIELPRTAHTQYFGTRRVGPREPLQPGDLIFYGHPSIKIHHVGLYIGNGQMINAPTFGMPVQVAAVGAGVTGAGRPVD